MPATLIPLLQNELQRVKGFHEKDLAEGHGAVYLPYALKRKYTHVLQQGGQGVPSPLDDLT